MDNTMKELSKTIFEKITQLNLDAKKGILITNFMENSLIDLAYLLSAKEDKFPLENCKTDKVYLFCTERNMFWRGRHGYTSSIREAQLFPLSVVKHKADEPQSTTKIVFFE